MPGPLPSPNRRRRNAPTIPTTHLPAKGRKGPKPKPPAWLELADAGSAWWAWAWSTPQAAAWNVGHQPMVARRASLEDDLVAIHRVEGLDLFELLGADTAREVQEVVRHVAGLATGRLAIARECRELEDRLGLTPKGQQSLRWELAADETADKRQEREAPQRRQRIRAVDPAG